MSQEAQTRLAKLTKWQRLPIEARLLLVSSGIVLLASLAALELRAL